MRRDLDETHFGAIHLFKDAVGPFQLNSTLMKMFGHFVKGIGEHTNFIAGFDLGQLCQVTVGDGTRGAH